MPFAKRTCSVKLDVYVGGALPRNRSRTGTIEPERWATSSVCVYVFLLVCRACMQAFKPLYILPNVQLSRLGVAGGHAGRSRDAKPGTSHREEVTAILHAAINLCSLTLLVNVRACGMFTFTQSVVTSKNVSQGTHHVRKSSRPSASVFPPTHLIVGARNCVRN